MSDDISAWCNITVIVLMRLWLILCLIFPSQHKYLMCLLNTHCIGIYTHCIGIYTQTYQTT